MTSAKPVRVSSRLSPAAVLLGLTASLVSLPTFAVESAADSNISVYPTVYNFGQVPLDAENPPSTVFSVSNIGVNPLTFGSLSVSGVHSDQFQILANQCSNQVLAGGESCDVNVQYQPDSRGHKQATLSIPSDAPDTPVLQAFMTSREDIKHEAARRLPPVLADVNIPETMQAGTTYQLDWTLLGYHEDYETTLVFFNCATDPNDCGSSYSDSTRFLSTGSLTASSSNDGPWYYNGTRSKEFHYSYAFTPSSDMFVGDTDVVIRFYRKNLDDKSAGNGSLSLIAPGNLFSPDAYYDQVGRRIKLQISPAS